MSVQRLGWCPGVSAKDRGHFSFGSVSNTVVRDLYLDVTEVDVVSIQVTSGGTLTATITVLGSNSFIPGPADATFGLTSVAAAAPMRAGSFVSLTSRVTGITNPAGSGGDCLINVAVAGEPFVSPLFLLIRYTPASGTGNLDMYVSGKSFAR